MLWPGVPARPDLAGEGVDRILQRARRSAYRFTNLGTWPVRSPAMSCQTSTCASVSGPAPMPTSGSSARCVIRLATSPGTISSTTAKAPASASASASAMHPSAGVAAALHPVAAQGVLALRGEADVRHHRDAGAVDRGDLRRERAAALELHRVAPPSFMNRTAVRSAWVGPSSYEPNGRSPTTRARWVERTTARTSGSSSSTVTGRVVSLP